MPVPFQDRFYDPNYQTMRRFDMHLRPVSIDGSTAGYNPGRPPCMNGENLLAPVGAVSTIPPLRGFIASRIHVICIIHARVKSTEKNVLANVFRREIIALDFHVDYSPCSTTI